MTPKKRGGWRNPAAATNGKQGGRPRMFTDVRIIAADVPALLAWLAEQRATLPNDHAASSGLDSLIAALWGAQQTEEVQ